MELRQDSVAAVAQPAPGGTREKSTPVVWVLTTERQGDNAQVLAIAGCLDWPHAVKQLSCPGETASVSHSDNPVRVRPGQASSLAPPWPDLLLTVGPRASLMATRIQKDSGGRTRLVQVGSGDTRQGLSGFDLVISNPQTRLPQRPNVMQLALPLLYPDRDAIAAASQDWGPRFESLPRPWTAVLVGGSTPPLTLGAAVARSMISEISRFVDSDGGSLLISTSPRTPAPVSAALRGQLPGNAFFHEWTPDTVLNPYPALLGLADRFVVTADSISMQTEVIRLGKPLAIYPLPHDGRTWRRRGRHLFRSLRLPMREMPVRRESPGLRERWADRLTRLGIFQHRRDFERFHLELRRAGRAVRFGDPFPPAQPPPPDERQTVKRRIEMLFDERNS